jgi:nucleoside-diphosphate-sugar epimerase
MKILILGAAGMLGRKLTERLVAIGKLRGETITGMVLADIVAPAAPAGTIPAETLAVDVARKGTAERVLESRPDVIFHLAAVVSGEAEADFDKGYAVNLDGSRYLFEAIRQIGGGYCPRLVFTSSIAVFGTPFPDAIGDEFLNAPLTSYGTQKAMIELLMGDYSRRGFLDGVGIRLPTIVVRPGKANKAASSFFSGIIREPLNGQEAVLPVDGSVRHWFASPRAAVGFMIHAAEMDTSTLGARRTLSMPGVSALVEEEVEALRKVGGDEAVALIKREKDPTIDRIVAGWARNFDTKRALDYGFKAEKDFDEIVRVYLEDELGRKS